MVFIFFLIIIILNFPANMGMLFLVGLSFSGGMLAHLLSWIYAPITALLVYAFTKTRWGNSVAITAASIVLFVPGVLIVNSDFRRQCHDVLWIFEFFGIVFLVCNTTKMLVCPVRHFCGLAVGSKYTVIVVTFFALELIFFCMNIFEKIPCYLCYAKWFCLD